MKVLFLIVLLFIVPALAMAGGVARRGTGGTPPTVLPCLLVSGSTTNCLLVQGTTTNALLVH